MRHLFPTLVRVERPTVTKVGGRFRTGWTPVPRAESVQCRLDLQFVRPGDIQPAIVAGKAPDRHGLGFFSTGALLRAGDRLVCTSGPVEGVFEIRTIPDAAQNSRRGHHIEVQVWETNRDLDALWPGA